MKHVKLFERFVNEAASLIDQIPGKNITDPNKYSNSDMKKLVNDLKKIKELESVSFYDDVVEANVEDQTYMYGWSDTEDCWTGTYLVDGNMETNLPMSKEEFVAAVKNAVAYL